MSCRCALRHHTGLATPGHEALSRDGVWTMEDPLMRDRRPLSPLPILETGSPCRLAKLARIAPVIPPPLACKVLSPWLARLWLRRPRNGSLLLAACYAARPRCGRLCELRSDHNVIAVGRREVTRLQGRGGFLTLMAVRKRKASLKLLECRRKFQADILVAIET